MKKLFLLLGLFCGLAVYAQTTEQDSTLATGLPAYARVHGDTSDANTQERIIYFHSDIQMDTAGWVTVTETIRVYSNQDQIRRGIFRSLPLLRANNKGRKERIDIEVTGVLKNGETEDYHTEEKEGNLLVYIGSADVFLDAGKYTYTIIYRSRGHIGFFEGFDELYWNITGNEWAFEIQGASVAFHLPAGAALQSHACYTGITGSKASDCSMQLLADGTPVFFSTGVLAPHEGLTAAVSWPEGIVHRPPPPGFWERMMNQAGLILGITGLLYLLYFFYTRWNRVGRDARDRAVMPVFTPPFQWSPAVLRYVYKRTVDHQGYTAAMVHMAIQKAMRIKEEEGSRNIFILEKGERGKLPGEENSIYSSLFSYSKSVRTSDTNHSLFEKAWSAFTKAVKAELDIKAYYNANWRAWWHGTWRTLVWLVLTLWLVEGFSGALPVWLVLPFWTGFLVLVVAGVRLWKRSRVQSFFVLLFFLPLLGVCTVFLVSVIRNFQVITIMLLVIAVAGYTLFVLLIPAYSEKGAEAKAAIAGFRMYLSAAEEQRLNVLTPPERTPELFEQLLPYAIALDVENAWGKQFESVLQAAGYSPDWYDGQRSYILISSSMPGSLSRSLTSAAVDPTASSSGSSSSGSSSWSSGSSGGGSSGGGGGGGGGGGW